MSLPAPCRYLQYFTTNFLRVAGPLIVKGLSSTGPRGQCTVPVTTLIHAINSGANNANHALHDGWSAGESGFRTSYACFK
jgi:hypothetical protein